MGFFRGAALAAAVALGTGQAGAATFFGYGLTHPLSGLHGGMSGFDLDGNGMIDISEIRSFNIRGNFVSGSTWDTFHGGDLTAVVPFAVTNTIGNTVTISFLGWGRSTWLVSDSEGNFSGGSGLFHDYPMTLEMTIASLYGLPLPAGAALLPVGLGMLAALRRRRQAPA